MSRLRTLVATCVLGLAATVAGAAPASAAVTGSPVEAEAMTTVAGRTALFSDAAASGRRGRVLVTNGAVRAVLRPTATAGRLVLRVRGDQAAGAPRAVVLVDGRQVSSVLVSSRTWVDHVVTGRWAPGAHTVVVRFVNDHRTATGADRNLRLDRVRFDAAPVTATATSTLDDAYEARVVQLVNAERTSRGLRPVAVSACADRYAEAWGVHLAGVRTLVHRSDLGSMLGACSASAVAENIAYGAVSADQLVGMWMASEGHRTNILNPAYTHVGTGATRTADGTVWSAQNFLRL